VSSVRTRRGRRDDAGFVTAWTVAVAVFCWALVGLVLDGGRALRERSDAFGAAAGAARAGVQEIDERAAVQGQLRLDEVAAKQAVQNYLAARGFTGTADVTNGVNVTVSVSGRTDLEILVVPDSVGYAVSASARAVQGDGPI
jgi:Putative Flp pilus-assembly TadE/G-like